MTNLPELARAVVRRAADRGLSIVTAESCTAGRRCALLADAPGAGTQLHGGFVTYTKAHKRQALGVPAALLADKGAVCGEVAAAMARGALSYSPSDIAIAITGVAGPEPDEDGNPVGRVCIGLARAGAVHQWEFHYGELARDEIQARAMADALKLLMAAVEESGR